MSDSKQHRQTWFSTGVFKGGIQRVDREAHALRGVTLANVGEAKGHGLWLDGAFVESVFDGVKGKNGLRSRLTHPGMCDDGTGNFLGKVKVATPHKAAFRGAVAPETDASEPHRYDLFMSAAAEDAPGKGDIRNWVETMASESPDMLGFSIVFRRDWEAEEDFHVANGAEFKWWLYDKGKRTEGRAKARAEIPESADYFVDMAGFKSPAAENVNNYEHARLKSLHAADIVGEPAATDALFADGSTSAVAASITEYLDLHPQIFEALKVPAIQDALLNYADRMPEFLNRYEQHRKETSMSTTTAAVKPEATKPETPAAAVAASAPPAAAEPAAAPVPVKPDALAEVNAKVEALTVELKTTKESLAAEQAKVAALLKGEKPVSASAAPGAGKEVPKTFWDK